MYVELLFNFKKIAQLLFPRGLAINYVKIGSD